MEDIADTITDELTQLMASQGDHVYPDVYWVTLGKLLDKQKLLGTVRRDGITIDKNYLTEQVRGVMTSFMYCDPDLMKDTAKYYQKKYASYSKALL